MFKYLYISPSHSWPNSSLMVWSSISGPFDICEVDIFNGTCPHGQMIIMTSAMYGRMSIGTCIRQHFSSHRNCDGDVLKIIDGICSGRQSCVVRPIDPALVTVKKCPEHSAYLRLSYDCIRCEYNLGSCLIFVYTKKKGMYPSGCVKGYWFLDLALFHMKHQS